MTLIDNWRRTLTHGYSAWCIYVAILLKLAAELLPYVGEVIPWWGSVTVLTLGLVVRLIKQKAVSGHISDEDDE